MGIYRFAEFELDTEARHLSRFNLRVRLPGKAFDLLLFLLQSPGRWFSREELIAHLWRGTHVDFDSNLNTTVRRLRLGLADTPRQARFLETGRRFGYRFVGAVLPEAPGDQEALRGASLAPAAKDLEQFTAEELIRIGGSHWASMVSAGLLHSVRYFDAAARVAPENPATYAWLARALITLGLPWIDLVHPDACFPRALAAAQRSLELDPHCADAHAAVALERFLRHFDAPAAERLLRLAVGLNSDSPMPLAAYALLQMAMRRFDAAEELLRQAMRLAPTLSFLPAQLAWVKLQAGDAAGTARQAQVVLALDPDNALGCTLLAIAWLTQKKARRAVDLLQSIPVLRRLRAGEAALACAYAQMGAAGEARAILAEMDARRRDSYVPAVLLAEVCAALRDRRECMRWLQVAVDERSPWLPFLADLPLLASCRRQVKVMLAPWHFPGRFRE
jgi:DNA-binding winged helix-turn-helix (wHTH) protein